MPRNTAFRPPSATSSEVSEDNDSEFYTDEDGTLSGSELDIEEIGNEDGETDSDNDEENIAPNVDDDEQVPLDRLTEATYTSADDIRSKLVSYHAHIGRDFRYVQNDGRRIYVACTDLDCSFKVNFNFRKSFAPPTTAIPHNCSAWTTHPTARADKAQYLSKRSEVVQWMQREQRNATSKGLRNLLLSIGVNVKYTVIFRTLSYLKNEMFAGDAEQYALLESYAEILNGKGHTASLERDADRKFTRMAIIYWQGIQEFSQYAARGMQLDGTFIKNAVGGTLLTACFKDGNNNIRIVAVAVVSGENEANWTWFLRLLHEKLTTINNK